MPNGSSGGVEKRMGANGRWFEHVDFIRFFGNEEGEKEWKRALYRGEEVGGAVTRRHADDGQLYNYHHFRDYLCRTQARQAWEKLHVVANEAFEGGGWRRPRRGGRQICCR